MTSFASGIDFTAHADPFGGMATEARGEGDYEVLHAPGDVLTIRFSPPSPLEILPSDEGSGALIYSTNPFRPEDLERLRSLVDEEQSRHCQRVRHAATKVLRELEEEDGEGDPTTSPKRALRKQQALDYLAYIDLHQALTASEQESQILRLTRYFTISSDLLAHASSLSLPNVHSSIRVVVSDTPDPVLSSGGVRIEITTLGTDFAELYLTKERDLFQKYDMSGSIENRTRCLDASRDSHFKYFNFAAGEEWDDYRFGRQGELFLMREEFDEEEDPSPATVLFRVPTIPKVFKQVDCDKNPESPDPNLNPWTTGWITNTPKGFSGEQQQKALRPLNPFFSLVIYVSSRFHCRIDRKNNLLLFDNKSPSARSFDDSIRPHLDRIGVIQLLPDEELVTKVEKFEISKENGLDVMLERWSVERTVEVAKSRNASLWERLRCGLSEVDSLLPPPSRIEGAGNLLKRFEPCTLIEMEGCSLLCDIIIPEAENSVRGEGVLSLILSFLPASMLVESMIHVSRGFMKAAVFAMTRARRLRDFEIRNIFAVSISENSIRGTLTEYLFGELMKSVTFEDGRDIRTFVRRDLFVEPLVMQSMMLQRGLAFSKVISRQNLKDIPSFFSEEFTPLLIRESSEKTLERLSPSTETTCCSVSLLWSERDIDDEKRIRVILGCDDDAFPSLISSIQPATFSVTEISTPYYFLLRGYRSSKLLIDVIQQASFSLRCSSIILETFPSHPNIVRAVLNSAQRSVFTASQLMEGLPPPERRDGRRMMAIESSPRFSHMLDGQGVSRDEIVWNLIYNKNPIPDEGSEWRKAPSELSFKSIMWVISTCSDSFLEELIPCFRWWELSPDERDVVRFYCQNCGMATRIPIELEDGGLMGLWFEGYETSSLLGVEGGIEDVAFLLHHHIESWQRGVLVPIMKSVVRELMLTNPESEIELVDRYCCHGFDCVGLSAPIQFLSALYSWDADSSSAMAAYVSLGDASIPEPIAQRCLYVAARRFRRLNILEILLSEDAGRFCPNSKLVYCDLFRCDHLDRSNVEFKLPAILQRLDASESTLTLNILDWIDDASSQDFQIAHRLLLESCHCDSRDQSLVSLFTRELFDDSFRKDLEHSKSWRSLLLCAERLGCELLVLSYVLEKGLVPDEDQEDALRAYQAAYVEKFSGVQMESRVGLHWGHFLDLLDLMCGKTAKFDVNPFIPLIHRIVDCLPGNMKLNGFLKWYEVIQKDDTIETSHDQPSDVSPTHAGVGGGWGVGTRGGGGGRGQGRITWGSWGDPFVDGIFGGGRGGGWGGGAVPGIARPQGRVPQRVLAVASPESSDESKEICFDDLTPRLQILFERAFSLLSRCRDPSLTIRFLRLFDDPTTLFASSMSTSAVCLLPNALDGVPDSRFLVRIIEDLDVHPEDVQFFSFFGRIASSGSLYVHADYLKVLLHYTQSVDDVLGIRALCEQYLVEFDVHRVEEQEKVIESVGSLFEELVSSYEMTDASLRDLGATLVRKHPSFLPLIISIPRYSKLLVTQWFGSVVKFALRIRDGSFDYESTVFKCVIDTVVEREDIILDPRPLFAAAIRRSSSSSEDDLFYLAQPDVLRRFNGVPKEVFHSLEWSTGSRHLMVDFRKGWSVESRIFEKIALAVLKDADQDYRERKREGLLTREEIAEAVKAEFGERFQALIARLKQLEARVECLSATSIRSEV